MTPASKLSIATFAALVAAGLSTAAFAQRGGPGLMAGMNFEATDTNKDGLLSKDEIRAFMTARATEADTNKDGNLSPEEMVAMHEKGDADRKLARANMMVERMDSDGNGLVSTAEMAAGRGEGKMFDRVDTDGDGTLSRAEIDEMRKHMGKHGKKGHGENMVDDG